MRPALVFLHGMGGSAQSWAPQEEAFAAAHKVLSWNAPGYGGRPLPLEFSFESLAAQLIGDLDAFGVERFIPVGHSFGGMVAQQVVRDYPERIAALILSGTSPAFGKQDGDFQRQFVAERLEPLERGLTLGEMAQGMVESLVGEAPEPKGVARAVEGMGNVAPETYRAVVELIVSFDLRANLSDIACPACLIAGGQDTTAPAAMMQRMAAKIPGSRFYTIAHAGHLANLERPAAFNDILDAFLKELV